MPDLVFHSRTAIANHWIWSCLLLLTSFVHRSILLICDTGNLFNDPIQCEVVRQQSQSENGWYEFRQISNWRACKRKRERKAIHKAQILFCKLLCNFFQRKTHLVGLAAWMMERHNEKERESVYEQQITSRWEKITFRRKVRIIPLQTLAATDGFGFLGAAAAAAVIRYNLHIATAWNVRNDGLHRGRNERWNCVLHARDATSEIGHKWNGKNVLHITRN